MPLPEQNILEQSNILAQQRNPGFETEGLPSPSGFDSPDIPSVAPIPIPGTGATEGNNGQLAYLDRFNQSILSTQGEITPGKLPTYSVSDVYNPRYRSILPGEDSEEAFAKGQSGWKQFGNALVKMGATAVGTFFNGMTAIPDTIGSINNGSPYDTAMGNSIDQWLENLEDKFPNYYTKWQQDHPFMSAVPFSGGFSNFWGDKFLKNLGFTVGAIGSAVVTDLAVGAVTEGIGEIPLIANQIGRASLWLNKIFTGTNRAEELIQLGRAAGRTGEQLFDLKQLAQAAAATKITNGTKYAINLYGASAAEAGFEARDSYNTVREDLIRSYINEKGYSPIGADLDQIDKYARAAGNVRFGANMALLGISNAIQFDALIKPFSAAKAGFRSTIEKDISQRTSIGLAEGSIDEFQRIPKGIWGKVRPIVPAILSEGVFEEGGQFATQVAVENFYERKYLYDKGLDKSNYSKDETPFDSRDHVKNVVHSVVRGLSDEFGTDEGLENVILGALTGAAFSGGKAFLSRKHDAQTTAATLQLLNGVGVTGIMQNHYDSAATSQRIAEDMKQAVKNNDIYKYKNFQHEQFVNFIISGAKAGRFDVRLEQLNMLKEMDNDEFKKAFGLDKTTENVKTASEYVNTLINKAEKLKKTYDLINSTYTNPFRYNGKDNTPEGVIENKKHQIFETWKDSLTYLASIASDVDTRIQSMSTDLRQVYPVLDHYHVSNFTDKRYLKNYATTLEQEIKSLNSLLDQKVSGDPEADRKRVKVLEGKVASIKSMFTDTGMSDNKFGNLFRDVLQFHLNGQNETGDARIPQEAVPTLINYGLDINRLKKYREDAYKAFDKLSTPEGFERYFREANNIEDRYSQQTPPPPPGEEPGTTPPDSPKPPTPPPAPKVVVAKRKDGTQVSFTIDKEYYVPVEKGKDPVKGTVVEQKPNGDISVKLTDGTIVDVPQDVFFAPSKSAEDIKTEVDKNTSVDDIPPPPPGTTGTKEGPQKKDLTFALSTTTDPVYSRQDIPFNNFHRRHQNFLFDMGSYDPDVFNQENKPKLRIIPVTAKTATALGFPANFITDNASDVNNSVIRAVYVVDDTIDPVARNRQRTAILKAVKNSKLSDEIKTEVLKSYFHQDNYIQQLYEQARDADGARDQMGDTLVDKLLEYGGQGLFFVDSKGNKMGRVGQPIDPNEAIFTTFTTTELTFQSSPGVTEERYTNKDNLDPKLVVDWWRQQRADILAIGTPQGAMQRTYQFAVSRGIPNVMRNGSRNNPIAVGLVRERDLDKPVITIPTLGTSAIMGAFNAEGEGIPASKSGVTMPPGTPLLNVGGNLVYLNARVFTPTEANNIFEILKIISDRNRSQDSVPMFKFLHKVIYMANPEKKIAPTDSSITIDGANLYLGTDINPIQLLPQALEDQKARIIDFLEKAHHNIKNSELLRIQKDPKANDLEFAELKVVDGKVEVAHRWKNYNYYLLSDRTPEGAVRADAPLAVNIVIPQVGEKPIIQKYSEILSFDFDASKFRLPEQVTTVDSQPVSEATVQNAKDALAKVLSDAKLVGGVTVQNLLDLREAYLSDPSIDKQQKSYLAGAVDIAIGYIEKKDAEQEVKPIAPPKVLTDDERKADIERRRQEELNRNQQEYDKAIDKLDKDFGGDFRRGVTPITPSAIYSKEGQIEVTKDFLNRRNKSTNAKYDAELSSIQEQKEEVSSEPIQFVPFKDKNLGFRPIARDTQGNITDIEPVGTINDDGTITPFKDPVVVKSLIMNSLAESRIKTDDTNSDKTKTTADKFKGRTFRRGTDRFRRAYPGNNNYVKGNLDQEFAEMKEILPDWFTFKKVDEMLRTTEGGLAWGAIEDSLIEIYKSAEVGTTYHEAFEAVWYHFVDGKEQQDIYNEFIGRQGEFTSYFGEKKKYSQATVKEAKEQLAEEFRDYRISGELPKQPKQASFFRRLLNFIKWLLGLESSKRNTLFKKMNKGYYRNYATSLRGPMGQPEYSYYREPGLSEFSESIVQDMLQGMTAELFGEIFGENTAIIDMLEQDFKLAASTIYDKLNSKLTYYFEDEVAEEGTLFAEIGLDWNNASTDDDRDAFVKQMDSIRDVWSRIKDNWGSFVKEHERYLRIFNVEFILDDEGEVTIAENQSADEIDSQNKSQTDYVNDMMTADAKASSSNRMKLLVASVADSEWVREATRAGIEAAKSVRSKRESSSVRLPKLVQYAKLFNYLLHNTASINGIYDIWDKLTEMTEDTISRKAIDANVRKFMSRLKFDNKFENKTQADVRLILSAENTLTKQKPAFFRQFTDFKKDTYFDKTVLNSKSEQIKSTWIAAIKGSSAVLPSAENRFLFSKSVGKIRNNIEFLNKLGIDITQADYKRLRGKKITDFDNEVNSIRSIITKAANNDVALPIFSAKQVDFSGRLTKLANLYIHDMVGEDTQSQHPNLDNQATSNFVLNNFVSTMVNDANNSDTYADFINKQDNGYLEDLFHTDSILLNKIIFDATGKKNKEVQIGVVEGRETWDGNNKSTSSLTEAERLLYEINNNLNGVFYTLLPADAKTEWAINSGTYLSADGFFGDDSSRANEVSAFATQMYKWLQTEIDLAKDFENRKFIDNLNRIPKGEKREVGRSLRFFKDILPKTVVEDINSRVIDGNESLGDVVSSDQMRAMMREYAWNRAQDTLKELIDWKVVHVKSDGKFALYGFDKTFVDAAIGKSRTHTRLDLERLLLFREMNYVMNNIEMHKFFFGDPAQYKDELKRIKSFLSGREYMHVDTLGTSEGFNQWANNELNKAGQNLLSLGDPGYQSFKNHFNTLTAYDITFASDVVEEIRKHLGEEAARAYSEGNEDDAGAYVTINAYREMMWKSGGRWTDAQEKQFQWEMAWERNDKAKEGKYTYSSEALRKHDDALLKEEPDTEVAFPILKLMHSGIQTNEDIAIVSLDKASWAPLFYRWYKDSTLGKMYDVMQKKGIDYIRMESAHKVGIQKASAFQMYDEKGEINTVAIENLSPEMIPIKQIGVQVEQAKKEKGQTEGSQLRKIAIGDLRENGVPIDFRKKYDTDQEAYDHWNNLETEEQKIEASPIYGKIKRHNDAIVNLTTIRTILTMRRLGMEEDDQGNVTIPDKKMISDFILSELERRELPRNIASSVQISPETRDFSNPIEANPQYTKIRSIIYSILEKTVTRPKVNGGQKTMLSVTGMEKGPRIVKQIVNGKPVYTADTLQFYKIGKTGTEACEVMLPYWFGKKLMESGSGRTKEEVIKYLNSTEEGRKLLMGIGFRIPTQGLNSIDFFIVKDFLPEQMGDVVVLPSEITVKAGSDFDIDKLNVYLRNFYVDNQSGFPELLLNKGSEEATKKYIANLIQDGTISDEQVERRLETYGEEEDEEGIFADVERRIAIGNILRKKESIIDVYYQEVLENEYFDAIQDLVSLPENYTRLLAPNDASELKGYRTKMLGLKGQSSTPLGDYGKLLSSTFMMKERQAYMASKQVVGISAVSQVAQAISQNLEGGLLVEDPSYIARFPANMINGKVSLSSLRVHGSERLISNINSQTTDGGVDVAKDKFLAEMGINKDTLSIFLSLVRQGAEPWWAILYLNQPSIQEFLKEKAISKSVSQINPNVKDESDYKLLTKTFKKFGSLGRGKKNIADKPRYYTQKEMEEMIKAYADNPQSLTMEQKKLQMMILDDFSYYDLVEGKYKGYSGLSWELFHFYQGYNWDTARVNDPNLMRIKALKYEKANTLSITPASKVMRDTFIGPMRDNLIKLDEGLRSIINVQHGAAGSILDEIVRDIFKMSGGEAVKQQLALIAELSLVDFATQTNGLFEGRVVNSMIDALLLSKNATAIYLDAIKRNPNLDRKLSENPLIKALVPNIDKRPGFPSTIQLLERDYDTYTSNVLTDSFRELREDATIISINDNPDDDRSVAQIYKRLVLTALIQGGARSGRGSFAHLIPSETYSEIVRDALRNMQLAGFQENLALYRGNWSNSSLVPNAMKEVDEIVSGFVVIQEDMEPYYKFFINPKVSATLGKIMNLAPENVPMLITQPATQYKKAKVIKIEEFPRDATGERKVRLFRRVDVYGKNGLVPLQYDRNRVIFAEINPWGDNNIREFYNGQTQSVLPHNGKVNEASDDHILYALHTTGIKTNAAEDSIYEAINMFEEPNMEDDFGNYPTEPDEPSPYFQIDDFEEFKNQLTKRCN